MFIQWPFLRAVYIPTPSGSRLKWQSPMFMGYAPANSPASPQTKHDKYTSPLKTTSMKKIYKKALSKKKRGYTIGIDIDTNTWWALDSLNNMASFWVSIR